MRILLFIIICLPFSCFCQSQAEMNMEAKRKYELADKKLNSTYQRLLREYSKDLNFVQNLKKSQRIWIQFRDSELAMMYPEKETSYYGSVFPLCWYSYMEELTKERIVKLSTWLTGVSEGEVCSGSIKTKY
jgi:uncharacterized protein YecT (DUF1311 family)